MHANQYFQTQRKRSLVASNVNASARQIIFSLTRKRNDMQTPKMPSKRNCVRFYWEVYCQEEKDIACRHQNWHSSTLTFDSMRSVWKPSVPQKMLVKNETILGIRTFEISVQCWVQFEFRVWVRNFSKFGSSNLSTNRIKPQTAFQTNLNRSKL